MPVLGTEEVIVEIGDPPAAGVGQIEKLYPFLQVHRRIAAQPEEGLERLAEATKLVEITQERWAEAEMHRLRGTLLLCMKSPTAAEDSYQKALVIARQQSAKLWELRAATSLARLWRDQGKRIEARNLLAPVYNWFTEGVDTPVLQDAKALLDQLA